MAKKFNMEMVRDLKRYWNKPKEGKFLSVKEFAAYCIGGMGVVGGSVLPTYVTVAYGAYIAVALGFTNSEIMWVGIATSIFTLIRSPIISMILDNTNTKLGKFRPYLIIMPIPIVIMFILIGWIPPMITTHITCVIVFTLLYNVLQFFAYLYSLSFSTLVQVISPSPEERTSLMSIGAFAYSLGPSIINVLFPVIANVIYTTTDATGTKIMGINTLGPYKVILPILAAVCFGLGLIAAFYTKERLVVAKNFKQKQKFFSGVKKTFSNKYFWIFNSSTVLGNFRLIGTTFTVWICTYMIAPRVSDAYGASAQSIFTTLLGTACIPGMLLAPYLIKKFGKKNLMIFSNLACVVFTIPMVILMIPTSYAEGALLYKTTPYLLLACSFMITLFNSIQVVTIPAINAQLYDYQQYKTGDRIEGFISQFSSVLLTAVGLGYAFIQPAVQEAYGYTGEVPGVASPLLQVGVLNPIMRGMLLIGVVSGTLSIIPMIFWDLTEKRHHQIIDILQVRAYHEDGYCDDDTAKELEQKIENGEENVLDYFADVVDSTESIDAQSVS